MIKAWESLVQRDDCTVELDIRGRGDLVGLFRTVAGRNSRNCRISVHDPIPYGRKFLASLRQYHAVVAPTLSDEQPRIIYDAYSQAVPVLASDTPGNKSCVFNERTGLLFRTNDADALADSIIWCSRNMNQLRHMGLEAIQVAQNMTHDQMHLRRWKLLLDIDNTA